MAEIKPFFLLVILILLSGCKTGEATGHTQTAGEEQMTAPFRAQTYTYQISNAYPHDPTAFTQGLIFYQGALYESTGLNGQSSIRKVDLQTGQVIGKYDVPAQYFGEGLTILKGRAFQLTWQSQRGFIYDPDSFQLLGTFDYSGEGWGLTHDGRSLIMSDGSNQIRFLDPENFQTQRIVSVFDGSRRIELLNELEYIRGEIYANVWQSDKIARIDPRSGRVDSWIDLSGLLPPEDRTRHVDVLNGIAYDQNNDRLFVTGKLWPKLFEIKIKPRRTPVERQK